MASIRPRTIHSGLEAGAVANLFGIQGEFERGGFKPTGTLEPGEAGQFAPALFTPERYQEVIDYLTREPGETPLGALAIEEIASPENLEALWNQYQTGTGALQGALQEGLNTGYLTDIAPIAAYYQRQLERDIVPQLAEQYAGTSGISSSDFERALVEAGEDLAAELGSLEFGAREAAAARRAQMVGLAPEVQAALLSQPTGYAADVLALGEQTQPGRRLLDAFLMLSGIDTGGQTFVQQPSGGRGETLSGVGSILGAIFPG